MSNDPDPSWLPTLDEAVISATLEVPVEGEPDCLALPARPGVAIFEDAGGQATLIATTADLRNLARTRLGMQSPEAGASAAPRADQRAITRRVLAIEAGSALEADVIYLAQARLRMPQMHRVVSERWRAWFVHIDPDAEFPQWTKSCLTGPVRARAASRAEPDVPGAGLILGPFADKDAAGRFIELVIDAFDLCREHHLLVLAPNARACPYKEMGRCPAPCDGTEPMPSFRLRVRRAAGFITGGLGDLRARLESDMIAASRAQEFEEAAAIKQQFSRIDGLMAPGFAHVHDLSCWNLAIVVPTARPGRGRVLLLAGGRLALLGESDFEADPNAFVSISTRLIDSAERAPAIVPDQAQLDTIAAVTRWLYAPATRRRGAAIRIRRGESAAALAAELGSAAQAVCKVKKVAPGPPVADQAMEA